MVFKALADSSGYLPVKACAILSGSAMKHQKLAHDRLNITAVRIAQEIFNFLSQANQ